MNLKEKKGKRALQILTAVLGLIPLITGIMEIFQFPEPPYSKALQENLMLESNLRFYGGVWFVLGVTIFWIIPRIETQVVLFRILWAAIFMGGVARIISMITVGMPPAAFVGFAALEVLGAPVFLYWHHIICKQNAISA